MASTIQSRELNVPGDYGARLTVVVRRCPPVALSVTGPAAGLAKHATITLVPRPDGYSTRLRANRLASGELGVERVAMAAVLPVVRKRAIPVVSAG